MLVYVKLKLNSHLGYLGLIPEGRLSTDERSVGVFFGYVIFASGSRLRVSYVRRTPGSRNSLSYFGLTPEGCL